MMRSLAMLFGALSFLQTRAWAQPEIPSPVLAAALGIVELRHPPDLTTSGVMVEGRKIITVQHFFKGIDSRKVTIWQGNSLVAGAPKIIRREESSDIAILEPRKGQRSLRAWKPLQISKLDPISKGQILFIVGLRTGVHSAGVVLSPGNGVYFELAPIPSNETICEKGDSGGAIVDAEGRLVGIIVGNVAHIGKSANCVGVIAPNLLATGLRTIKVSVASPDKLSPEEAILAGGHYCAIGNYDQAVKFYERSLKDNLAGGSSGLCFVYRSKGEFDRAIAHCKKASEAESESLDRIARLAQAYLEAKKPQKALALGKKLIAALPEDAGVQAFYGEILEKNDRLDEAKTYYLQSLDKTRLEDQDRRAAYSGLVFILSSKEDYRGAWRFVHQGRVDGIEFDAAVTDWLKARMPEPAVDDDP